MPFPDKFIMVFLLFTHWNKRIHMQILVNILQLVGSNVGNGNNQNLVALIQKLGTITSRMWSSCRPGMYSLEDGHAWFH